MAAKKFIPLPRRVRAVRLSAEVMPEARAVARVIRCCRQQRHFSQNKLARLSGVSRQMIANIENDVNTPSQDTVARLAAGLGVPYEWIHVNAARLLADRSARCRACQYSCLPRVELPCLNAQRACTRTAH